MSRNAKALRVLLVPIALTLCSAPAAARKKKTPPPAAATPDESAAKEQAPPAAPPPEPPPPAPAVSGSATVGADATATPPPASVGVSADVSVSLQGQAPVPGAPPPQPPPLPPVRDGARFRGGISAGGGGEFVSGFTAGLGGIDGRLGAQINNLIGVYFQPHVAFGYGTVGGTVSGPTGNFAAAAMVDFTFIDRIFVGAGAGFGVTNSPYGALVGLRFGGYPVLRKSLYGPRRKGLMVGADFRTYIVGNGGSYLPIINIMASVGYEAF